MMPQSAQRFSPPRLETVKASWPMTQFFDETTSTQGRLAAIDLEQADAGAVILADDFCFELLAAGHRDDHVLRAEEEIVNGQDKAVGADDGAGAAAVGTEADRGRDMGRGDMRMDADGGAQNFFEQKRRGVHDR